MMSVIVNQANEPTELVDHKGDVSGLARAINYQRVQNRAGFWQV